MTREINTINELIELIEEEKKEFSGFKESITSYLEKAMSGYYDLSSTIKIRSASGRKRLKELNEAFEFYKTERPDEEKKVATHLEMSLTLTDSILARRGSNVSHVKEYLTWVIKLDATLELYKSYSNSSNLNTWQVGLNLAKHLKARLKEARELKLDDTYISPLNTLLEKTDRFSTYLSLRDHICDGEYAKAGKTAEKLGVILTERFYSEKASLGVFK